MTTTRLSRGIWSPHREETAVIDFARILNSCGVHTWCELPSEAGWWILNAKAEDCADWVETLSHEKAQSNVAAVVLEGSFETIRSGWTMFGVPWRVEWVEQYAKQKLKSMEAMLEQESARTVSMAMRDEAVQVSSMNPVASEQNALVLQPATGNSLDEQKIGKDSDAPPETTQEDLAFDIEAAILAHENWKFRLSNYIAGKSEEDLRPEVVCLDNRCDLGKWLHGSGGERFGYFKPFTMLIARHQYFHTAASSVVALSQAQDNEKALKVLDSTYHNASRQVVWLLQNLKAALAREKKQYGK